jgi:indole-3-glycerol phosphate synthase
MEIPGILGEIVSRTLEDVRKRCSQVSVQELEEWAEERSQQRHDFAARIRRSAPADPIHFISEIKKASPSKGVLRKDLDPADLAAGYRDGGSSAISVVTEPHLFQGENTFLEQARFEAPDLPLLCKDFHVDELQVMEAAAGVADALLLLTAVLSPTQLKDYLDIADAFALGHIVEVNDRREAETAIRAGARVVGVNNRDLSTFDVDPVRTEMVLPVLEEAGVVIVAESGIHDRETVLRFEELGVDALLVGEALVVADDPLQMLLDLRGVSR